MAKAWVRPLLGGGGMRVSLTDGGSVIGIWPILLARGVLVANARSCDAATTAMLLLHEDW